MTEYVNCLIGYPNQFADATLTPLGAAWQSTLPLTNMLPGRGRVGYPARSANALVANTGFKITCPGPRFVTAIAAVASNLTTSGLWRMRGWNDSGLTSARVSSDWQEAWPTIFTPEQLEWEDDHWWTLTIAEDERRGTPSIHLWNLPEPTAAQWWTVEFDDPLNPDTVIDLRRLYGARGFQPALNMDWGPGLSFEHRAVITEAEGGHEHMRALSKRRVQTFALNALSEDEAMGRFYEIQRSAGITGEILWIFNPADTRHLIRRSFVGRLPDSKMPPITMPYLDEWHVQANIREIIL